MISQRSGSVTVTSMAGVVGYRCLAAWTVAKYGQIGLTRAAALDYAPHGTRCDRDAGAAAG